MRQRRRELLGQVRDVIVDVPRFATAPLYRRWHQHWGSSDAEATASMPGDSILPRAPFRATRSITIDAPPGDVSAILGIVLMEFGDFAMCRRMLLGIKSRAESHPTFRYPHHIEVIA